MKVSDVVYGHLEPATIADASLHTYLPELAATAWQAGLERHLLPICQYEGGYYVIDQEGGIQQWPDDTNGQWPSIWHWVDDVWLAD